MDRLFDLMQPSELKLVNNYSFFITNLIIGLFDLIDINYKYKLASSDDNVETCNPNPCQFGGKCVSVGNIKRCQCAGHFTGRFVA